MLYTGAFVVNAHELDASLWHVSVFVDHKKGSSFCRTETPRTYPLLPGRAVSSLTLVLRYLKLLEVSRDC